MVFVVTGAAIGMFAPDWVGFLGEPDNQETAATLRDVYISAYGQEDVDAVIGTLDQRFPRATPG